MSFEMLEGAAAHTSHGAHTVPEKCASKQGSGHVKQHSGHIDCVMPMQQKPFSMGTPGPCASPTRHG